MKVVLLILAVLVSSPAVAAGTCKNGSCKMKKVYIPTVGSESYTTQHPAVVRPTCKNGKCSLKK